MTNSTNKIEPTAFDSIEVAQSDMQKGYGKGSIGIMVSGLVWMTAGGICYLTNPKSAMWALLIGGMMIHPLGMILCKLLGIKGEHSTGNPLAKSAMEGTFYMLLCLPLAIGLSYQKPEWFFLAMLLIIGGRYLTFQTLYGLKIYWVLGATLVFASYLLLFAHCSSIIILLTGSIIELAYGSYLFLSLKKEN